MITVTVCPRSEINIIPHFCQKPLDGIWIIGRKNLMVSSNETVEEVRNCY